MTMKVEEIINAQNEPFKYAVFSGGGAKGAIYSGVHEELIKSGVLDDIEMIAGSSAGAITAAFLSIGLPLQDMKKIFLETNLNELQGSGIIQKDAKPLYELLHDTINSNIEKYFEKNTNITEKLQTRLDEINNELSLLDKQPDIAENIDKIKLLLEDKEKLEELKFNPDELFTIQNKAQNNGQVTFGDLDMLRVIDPKIFKGLIVTATNKETGELTIFDAKNFPNVEIALACRASASLPVRFTPVEIDGVEYVDGGYRDNIPQKHFDRANKTDQEVNDSNEINEKKKQKRTLVLAFGSNEDDSPAHVAVYSTKEKIVDFGAIEKLLIDVIFKFVAKVGGEFVYTEEENKNLEDVRENALNTIILDTKDVSTLDFKKAEKKAEYLHEKGKIQASRYFNNHGIGKNQDKNLERKEFILHLYEQNKQENLNLILTLCKDETWENNKKTDIYDSLINLAAQTKNPDIRSSNTKMMKKIVNTLNEPTTPTIIKKDFIKLLNIETPEDISDYKFQTKDFDKFFHERGIVTKESKGKSFTRKLLEERSSQKGQARQP